MTKLFFLCRRRGDLTHDEYVERLLGGHVPLALAHHPTLRRYVVNVVEATRGPAPPLDSIGTLWFDSLADYRERLYDSPGGERAIAGDVAGFLGRADAYATTEHVQRAPADPPSLGRTPGVKLLVALGRAPGQSREDFLRHWLERHVPLALEHHGMSRYVTSVVDERLGGDAPPYDGFAEIQFASAEDLERRLYLSAEGKAAIERDVGRFLGTIHAYYVAEHVARWVEHRPGRFSIRVGDAEAFLVYERRGDVLDLLHTYTPPALRGRNLAAELTRAALEHARAEGLRVVPTCPYTRRYLARHPELRGLVG